MARNVKVNLQPLPTYGELLHEIFALKQQVANLEEYMLKGVAFRDELQARVKELESQLCAAREAAALAVNHLHASNETKEKVYAQVKTALSSSSPCRHEEEAKRLREENRLLMQSNLELLDEQKTIKRDLLVWAEYGHKRGIDVVDLLPKRR